MKSKQLLAGFIIVPVLAVTGCGGQQAAGGSSPTSTTDSAKPASSGPVNLVVYNGTSISDDNFQLLFSDPVKKKYPNITLQLVNPPKGGTINEVIASGTVPDIVLSPNADLLGYGKQDLLYDITPLLKPHQIDLNRFEPATIASIKSDKGELWGLPYAMQFDTLYYNKDIFDKFGVPYPKDGMNWDDAIALGKQLTRKEGSTQFRGLDVVSSYLMSFPFALPYVDGKTNKAAMDNEKWKRVFETTKQIQTITGNEPPNPEPGASTEAGYFIKDKNIAMLVSVNLITQFGTADQAGLNWDIAQYPSYKELPGISGKVDSHNMAVTKESKHKEEAMDVLGVVTSDEVQLVNVRKTAQKSPLVNAEVQKQFAADLPYMKGKNVAAIFKGKVVAAPVYSQYEIDGKKIGQQAFRDYLSGNVDVNTALKQADAKINELLSTK